VNAILNSAQPVVERASDVSIDAARLADVASWLAYEELPVPPVFLPFRVDRELIADFVLVASCLNFAFTDFSTRQRWDLVLDGRAYADADGLHAALWRAVGAGVPVLDGAWLAAVTPQQLGMILPGIQLLEERAAVLRQVGARLVERWDGRFSNVLAASSDSVESFLALLTSEFPRFDDRVGDVRFWKLAQLSAWILHIEGAVAWRDLGELTAFADYIVPAALRALGILRYSQPLAQAVDSWSPIEAGSGWEVEIRAATVWACHLLADAVNALRPPELQVVDAQIDARLWLPFHKTHAPHHLTDTIYY
jgi:Potential Queuosine, Q, salvage protein family